MGLILEPFKVTECYKFRVDVLHKNTVLKTFFSFLFMQPVRADKTRLITFLATYKTACNGEKLN
jgi:hypothetical protein